MTIKIAILGADKSGKTQLLQRMMGGEFGKKPFENHSAENPAEWEQVSLYDISGQVSFPVDDAGFECLDSRNCDFTVRKNLEIFLQTADAVLFCVDATDKDALNNTEKLFTFYNTKGFFPSNTPIYFVLTKDDKEAEPKITNEQLSELSDKLTGHKDNIFYTSAKKDVERIKELNKKLVQDIQQPKQISQKQKSFIQKKQEPGNFQGLVIHPRKQNLFSTGPEAISKTPVQLSSNKTLETETFYSVDNQAFQPEAYDAVFLVVPDLTPATLALIKREYDHVVQKLTKANIQIFLIYRPEGQKKDEEKEIKPISDDIPDVLQKFAETLHIPKKHIIFAENNSKGTEEKILKEKLNEALVSITIQERDIKNNIDKLIVSCSSQELLQGATHKFTKEAVRKILKETNDTLPKLLLLQNIFLTIKKQEVEDTKANKLWTHNQGYTEEQLANINTLKELFVECLHDTPYHRYDVAFNNQLRKLFSRKNGLDQEFLIDFQQTRYKSLVTKETTTRKHIDSLMQGIGRNTPAQATVYTARRMRI